MDRYRRIAKRANSWPGRLIKYLTRAEGQAETPNEQENYCFCRRLVSLALDGWSDPFVAAFYYHYGRHPNKLIPEWLQRKEKDRRLDIPDYDPLSDPLCKVQVPRLGLMDQMSASGWPAEQDSPRPNPFLEARRQAHKEWRQRRIGVLMLCTQCQNPICEESRCLCAFHLQRAREARAAYYMRERLAMGKTVKHCKGWQERQLAELVGLA